ncbi:uncharacterized protein EAF01_004340 [Botrytis porri]|uniref:uncharacterized protein n=1 Tax=Botrytis porri TaxID=87229 RepID=UPI001901586C|nr:uncharacterized protein EAF01_004340 [Botrytis porri]KAF7908585.1 hypothetical protein EAF01_004340 [Botrytis porri]
MAKVHKNMAKKRNNMAKKRKNKVKKRQKNLRSAPSAGDVSDFEEEEGSGEEGSGGIELEDQAPSFSDEDEGKKSGPKTRTNEDKRWGTLCYAEGTNSSLPPLTTATEFLEGLIDKLLAGGFGNVMKHLNGRPLRVATACSGTEAPIMFLKSFSEGLRKRGYQFEIEHVFSCEIDPAKQSYIRRNFPDVPIFRDITEVFEWEGNPEKIGFMTTAFGTTYALPAPGEVDVIIVGTSCTSYSNLNSQKSIDLERDQNESSRTFRAYVLLIKHLKAKIAISENVQGGPFVAMIEMLGNHGYIGGSANLDSKHYGIPQTRQRGYLVSLLESSLGGPDDVANYKIPSTWKVFFTEMKVMCSRDASSGVEFWMEPSDSKPLRAQVEFQVESRSVAKWDTCHTRHYDYRAVQGFGPEKPITDWRSTGKFIHLDHWPRNLKGFVERVHDVTDISHLRGICRGYDDRYLSRNIDLSQNVYIQHDNVKCGLMPCLTPNGVMWNTARGSKLSGEEYLRLQGIDTDSLELGGISQQDLRNLAGNAMTITVVGSVVSYALLRFFSLLTPGDGVKISVQDTVKKTFRGGKDMLNSCEDITVVRRPFTVGKCIHLVESSAKYCYCEARTDISRSTIVKCKNCGHVSCTTCGIKPRHAYEPLGQYVGPRGTKGVTPRNSPASVEFNIAESLPMIISISGLFASDCQVLSIFEEVATGDIDHDQWAALRMPFLKCLQSTVRFQTPVRSFAWNFTWLSEHARLELSIGEKKIQWVLYALPPPSTAVNSSLRKYLTKFPLARTVPIYTSADSSTNIFDCTWQIWQPKIRTAQATINYSGELIFTYENSIGLPAWKGDLIFSKIAIQIPDNHPTFKEINGVYVAHPECQQAFNSYHSKQGTVGGDNHMHFFYDHEGGTGDWNKHGFVFTYDQTRKECGVYRQIVAALCTSWEQPIAKEIKEGVYKCGDTIYEGLPLLKKGMSEAVEITSFGSWTTTPKTISPMATKLPDRSSMVVYEKLNSLNPKLLLETDCKSMLSAFSCKAYTNVIPCYWEPDHWINVTKQNGTQFFKDCYHLLARGLVTIGIDEADPPWIPCSKQSDSSCRCDDCAPPKPDMLWCLKRNGQRIQQTPFENPPAAAIFETLIKNAPPSMQQWVRFLDKGGFFQFEYQFLINPAALCHQAAGLLDLFPRPEIPVELSWRFLPGAWGSSKLPTRMFSYLNTESLKMSIQPPTFVPGKKLRNEQLKTLAWMVNQERHPPSFMEREVVEACQKNLAFRLEGRASRMVEHRAGLIAAAVGYGKTILTFALMSRQRKVDRLWANAPNTDGQIQVKATLVMVPTHLTLQWRDEACLFFGYDPKDDARIITLRAYTDVRALTVEDVRRAELVICSSGLFDNEGYLKLMAKNAGVVNLAKGATDRAKEAWYLNAQKERRELLAYLLERLPIEVDENDNAASARNAQTIKNFNKKTFQKYKKNVADAGVNEPHIPSMRRKGAELVKYLMEEAKRNFKGKGKPRTNVLIDEADAEKTFEFHYFEEDCVDGLTGVCLSDFAWSRCVIDEVGYITRRNMQVAIYSLKAQSRWALSATPDITDFKSTSRIARCLGINLGVDDQETIRNDKNLTSTERFLSYGPDASATWHSQRLQVAQKFCDTFIRYDAKKGNGQYNRLHRFIVLPFATAQLASYLIIKADVINQSYMMPRAKANTMRSSVKLENSKVYGKDTDGRLRLTKAASFFPEHATNNPKYKLKTIKDLKATALEEINTAKDYMRRQIEFLDYLATEKTITNETQLVLRYRNWENQVLEGKRYSDPDAFLDILQVIKGVRRANANKTRDDFYYENPDPAYGRRIWPSQIEKILHNGRRMLAIIAHFKTGLIEVHKTAMDLMQFRADYRYYRSVGQIDRAGSKTPTGDLTCNFCNKSSPFNEAVVQGNCGHILCSKCNKILPEGNCPVEHCGGQSLDDQKYLASSLYSSAGKFLERKEPGTEQDELSRFWNNPIVRVDKLTAMRSIFWKHDDGENKFIVFSHLPEFLAMAQKMMEADGIPCISLKGKKKDVADYLENFKQNKGMRCRDDKKQVKPKTPAQIKAAETRAANAKAAKAAKLAEAANAPIDIDAIPVDANAIQVDAAPLNVDAIPGNAAPAFIELSIRVNPISQIPKKRKRKAVATNGKAIEVGAESVGIEPVDSDAGPVKSTSASVETNIQVNPASQGSQKRKRNGSVDDTLTGPVSKVRRVTSLDSINQTPVASGSAPVSNFQGASVVQGDMMSGTNPDLDSFHTEWRAELNTTSEPGPSAPIATRTPCSTCPVSNIPAQSRLTAEDYMMTTGLAYDVDHAGTIIYTDQDNPIRAHELIDDDDVVYDAPPPSFPVSNRRRSAKQRRKAIKAWMANNEKVVNYPPLDFSELEDIKEAAAPEVRICNSLSDDLPVDWARVGKEAFDPEDFAENPDPTARVLFLDIADESAAGSNLTVAKHIIFLNPYYAEKQKYNSSMTQAMGRAIRHGQERGGTVTVHHLLVQDSVETDIAFELMDDQFPGRVNATELLAKHKSNIEPAFFHK